MFTSSGLHSPCALVFALVLCSSVLPSAAQYKVVRPDGSTTYTDRPPTDGSARVIPMGQSPGAAAAAATGDIGFPRELRLAAQRYPVLLYTTPDCTPCDTGRQWLLQRGLPFTEKRIQTQDDEQALVRLVGGRSVPSLTIGAQPVRGFAESEWLSYLDAAGYPRDARVPRGWQPPPVTPLVATADPRATAAAALPAPQAEPQRPSLPAPAALGSIRF